MSSIHYKFRATLEYKTLTFDGLHISVSELKRVICEKENIKAESFDLILTNTHTKRLYQDDELIPRNSSVVVQRVPRENAVKLPKVQDRSTEGIVKRGATLAQATSAVHVETESYSKMTEDERLTHMKEVSAWKYQPDKYEKKPSSSIMTGPPPPTYTCNRCYQPGHWYKNCPMLNQRRTTGIPSEELMETTADDPAAMVHPVTGKYVIPIMHYRAREQSRAMKSSDTVHVAAEPPRPPPPELTCPLCGGLLRDAVLAVCCGESFCSDCVSHALLESETKKCPGAGCTNPGELTLDSLVANVKVRQAADAFRNAIVPPPSSSSSSIELPPPSTVPAAIAEPTPAIAPRLRIDLSAPPPQSTPSTASIQSLLMQAASEQQKLPQAMISHIPLHHPPPMIFQPHLHQQQHGQPPPPGLVSMPLEPTMISMPKRDAWDDFLDRKDRRRRRERSPSESRSSSEGSSRSPSRSLSPVNGWNQGRHCRSPRHRRRRRRSSRSPPYSRRPPPRSPPHPQSSWISRLTAPGLDATTVAAFLPTAAPLLSTFSHPPPFFPTAMPLSHQGSSTALRSHFSAANGERFRRRSPMQWHRSSSRRSPSRTGGSASRRSPDERRSDERRRGERRDEREGERARGEERNRKMSKDGNAGGGSKEETGKEKTIKRRTSKETTPKEKRVETKEVKEGRRSTDKAREKRVESKEMEDARRSSDKAKENEKGEKKKDVSETSATSDTVTAASLVATPLPVVGDAVMRGSEAENEESGEKEKKKRERKKKKKKKEKDETRVPGEKKHRHKHHKHKKQRQEDGKRDHTDTRDGARSKATDTWKDETDEDRNCAKAADNDELVVKEHRVTELEKSGRLEKRAASADEKSGKGGDEQKKSDRDKRRVEEHDKSKPHRPSSNEDGDRKNHGSAKETATSSSSRRETEGRTDKSKEMKAVDDRGRSQQVKVEGNKDTKSGEDRRKTTSKEEMKGKTENSGKMRDEKASKSRTDRSEQSSKAEKEESEKSGKEKNARSSKDEDRDRKRSRVDADSTGDSKADSKSEQYKKESSGRDDPGSRDKAKSGEQMMHNASKKITVVLSNSEQSK